MNNLKRIARILLCRLLIVPVCLLIYPALVIADPEDTWSDSIDSVNRFIDDFWDGTI